jgi:GNAT superfamily N-acetyltransferase
MSGDTLVYASFDAPPASHVQAVDSGLDEYNRSVAPLDSVKPLATFATAPSGQVVGGAVGRTWGECCELQQLWVEAKHRSAGVGSRLLRQFEDHARRRGCTVFYLTTLSFQAPEFYRKHGYATLAEIAGHADGITKHIMHKNEA